MPDPTYNPWATPMFPNTGSAYGVGSPAEASERQPTFVDSLLSHIAGALGRGFMAPGQALQSTTPITSEQMIQPAQDMLTLAQTAGMPRAAAGNAAGELGMAGGGIKAYHGSPHDFDRFDLSKIGTGEGAQAYGHGLYFAENEATAKSYREALAGKPYPHLEPHAIKNEMADIGGFDPQSIVFARTALGENRGNVAETLRTLDQVGLNGHARAREAAQIIRSMSPTIAEKAPGKMYEVNINADPAQLLNWDAKLGQQPPAVQDVFRKQLDRFGPDANMPAQMMIAGSRTPGGLKTVSDNLREAGVPGIQYLDQGSRGAGQGSSNYVVFNDRLIDILKKYAIPGMMGAPIFATAVGENKQ